MFEFWEYTRFSTIHGARFLNEKGRYFIEKIFWALILTMAILLSASSILVAYKNWQTDPIIITFAGRYESIMTLPAPAITFCPNIKSFNTPFNLGHALEHPHQIQQSSKSRALLATMLKICENTTRNLNLEADTISEDDIFATLLGLQPTDKEDIFVKCGLANNILQSGCDVSYFSLVPTEAGVCYTFNGLPGHELWKPVALNPNYPFFEHEETGLGWTMDEGYTNFSIYYPLRSFSAYYKLAAAYILTINLTNYDPSCTRDPGFKVVLHSPGEAPSLMTGFIALPANKQLTVVVKPHVIRTSDELRTYDPEIRQCYFNNEKFLRYFRMYSQHNCQVECLSNYTAQVCGCVEFYMPRSTDIPICGLARRECTIRAGKNKQLTCNCLPGCNSLRYDTELQIADTHISKLSKKHNLAMLSVTYKWNNFMPLKRSAVTGPLNFVANSGGLLGLLMGVSFLSVVEVLYFFTVRWIINFCRRFHMNNRDH